MIAICNTCPHLQYYPHGDGIQTHKHVEDGGKEIKGAKPAPVANTETTVWELEEHLHNDDLGRRWGRNGMAEGKEGRDSGGSMNK